jgi:hypothetical protein
MRRLTCHRCGRFSTRPRRGAEATGIRGCTTVPDRGQFGWGSPTADSRRRRRLILLTRSSAFCVSRNVLFTGSTCLDAIPLAGVCFSGGSRRDEALVRDVEALHLRGGSEDSARRRELGIATLDRKNRRAPSRSAHLRGLIWRIATAPPRRLRHGAGRTRRAPLSGRPRYNLV